ncbi:GNAT family N-acetyltransferase [Paenibacillus turpanensis]|uniref:GNAT family N-acetyltransferase n=1 Tax=Paenibacillus turpanensis TaxID=2689078 RepID=UPI001408BC0A|nr:N-acetyltransferase [Paenibacillus turpanensis]
MIIRTEEKKDYEAVYSIHYHAFGGREDESTLVERIRASSHFVPELSIVAEQDGRVVGHILLSEAVVVENDLAHKVIVLAPIAVIPDQQKRKIGSMLVEEGLSRCRELGAGLVFLIGHPSYYPRFGFKPARAFQFELLQFKVPDEVFMVCELAAGELEKVNGELQYPETFFT